MSALEAGEIPGDGNVRISYQVDGQPGAPWMILSNSLATDRRMWAPQVGAFARSRRILRYDTRGHGASEAAPGPYTFDQLTGDVLAICDRLEIDRADFVGLSLGGMTGLALAMRAPERIGNLVCCDARAFAPEPYRAMWDGNIARLRTEGINSLIEPTIGRWFTPDFVEASENRELLESVGAMISGTSAEGYEGVARLLQSLDLRGGLTTLKPRTLYITGDADVAAPAEVVKDMADQTPEASLIVLKDAAHLSNMQQPEDFSRAVAAFLGMPA